MSGFIFNDISSKSKYIAAIKSNRVLVAENKHQIIDVPYSDNAVLIPDTSKKPFTLPIECLVVIPSNKTIFDVAREWALWLSTSTWSRLIFEDDPNYYYEAVCTSSITVNDLRDTRKNSVTLEFVCRPTQKAV